MTTRVSNLTGRDGGKIVATTAATTPASGVSYFQAILIVNDANFSALTMDSYYSGSGLTGIVITAGTVIYGRITAFTLASGVVIAYNADNVA